MKIGSVRSEQGQMFPMVSLQLLSEGRQSIIVQALLDSGFSGAVSLPQEMVDKLGLESVGGRYATLADGIDQRVQVYIGSVQFAGDDYRSAIQAFGDEPMVGMHLLQSAKICFEAVPDGDVNLKRLNCQTEV